MERIHNPCSLQGGHLQGSEAGLWGTLLRPVKTYLSQFDVYSLQFELWMIETCPNQQKIKQVHR